MIYVNDNFGLWHSERSALVDYVGDRIIDPTIRLRDDDFFIIKPQFSGFYATNLQVLLPKLGVTRLVLTGVATDICILFTQATPPCAIWHFGYLRMPSPQKTSDDMRWH